MADLYEIIEEISHSRFIEMWEREEQNNEHGPDGSTLQRIEELRAFSDLKCYVIRLTESGLNGLLLPHPQHSSELRVGEQGEVFRGVISNYLVWRAAGHKDGC